MSAKGGDPVNKKKKTDICADHAGHVIYAV